MTIVLDEMLAIHGLALMPGRSSALHLAMPSHRHSDGSRRDTAHPINAETRAYIEKTVFDAYKAGQVQKREIQ